MARIFVFLGILLIGISDFILMVISITKDDYAKGSFFLILALVMTVWCAVNYKNLRK
jgi:hypothetical protein